MSEPVTLKKHHVGDLTAYYTRQGRLWWVEQGGAKETFTCIEDMVSKYPLLLEVEEIAKSVERRALSRDTTKEVTLNTNSTGPKVHTKVVECYYCNGSGEVAFMPCPNCGGVGKVEVSTRGIG